MIKTGFDQAIIDAEDSGHRDLARRIKAEKRMCTALVSACLKRGYEISVSDGEDWPVKRSNDKPAILAALFSTDEDVIVIRAKDGSKAGWFRLIYGNDGYDVISDYSVTDPCEAIWNEVIRPLSDKIEQAA